MAYHIYRRMDGWMDGRTDGRYRGRRALCVVGTHERTGAQMIYNSGAHRALPCVVIVVAVTGCGGCRGGGVGGILGLVLLPERFWSNSKQFVPKIEWRKVKTLFLLQKRGKSIFLCSLSLKWGSRGVKTLFLYTNGRVLKPVSSTQTVLVLFRVVFFPKWGWRGVENPFPAAQTVLVYIVVPSSLSPKRGSAVQEGYPASGGNRGRVWRLSDSAVGCWRFSGHWRSIMTAVPTMLMPVIFSGFHILSWRQERG